MLCADGQPCSFPCHKIVENSGIEVSQLGDNCPLRYKGDITNHAELIAPLKKTCIGPHALYRLADLCAYSLKVYKNPDFAQAFSDLGKTGLAAEAQIKKFVEALKTGMASSKNPPVDDIFILLMLKQWQTENCQTIGNLIQDFEWPVGTEATLKEILESEEPPAVNPSSEKKQKNVTKQDILRLAHGHF